MPQKRRRRGRRGRPLQDGFSRRRLGEDGASLTGSLVDSDGSSTTSPMDVGSPLDVCSPPPDEPSMSSTEPMYLQIIASRLARLELPADEDDNRDSADLPKRRPSIEIVQALTRKSFLDDELRAAMVEYQCNTFQGSDIQGRDRDSGESDSEPDDVIPEEEYSSYRQVLVDRTTEVDTYTEMDQEQTNELVHLRHALYRIKAALLLKGKPVDELDDAALKRKYPRELIIENKYFFHYVRDGRFGWLFDTKLCYKKFLSDYQRLVLLNDGGDEYTDYTRWSTYRAFYSTPEADRAFLQYWEALLRKMKWLEHHVLKDESSYEWLKIHSKAMFQAASIAAGIPNMTLKLADLGLDEYIWITQVNLRYYKYLDGIFYAIWRLVNKDNQLCFKDALRQVYNEKLFPAHDTHMKNELARGGCKWDLLFHKCTKGLNENVPEYRAIELIGQEIRWRRAMPGSYERYARNKLKIAELIGLIPKDKRSAA